MAQVLWLWPAPRKAGALYLETRPRGAAVWVQRIQIGHLRAGAVGSGYRLVWAGRAPGPLNLDPTRPSDLVVRLAGYEDAAVRLTPGVEAATLALTPRWPVLAPLLYAARDFGWSAVAALLLGIAARRARQAGALAREAERGRLALALGQVGEGVDLAGYRLGPCVGRGGAARVYHAWRVDGGEEVAVKVLSAAASPALGDEVRGLRALAHPNVTMLLDWGQAEDFHFLVTELVDGETLQSRLRRGPLPAADAIRLGRELADALAHAHRRGIIHRDLKPANVMLDRRGRSKITDFGIARPAGDAAAAGGGTPGYMAPEQARGGAADARGDVYALGAVLYEATAGQPAFPGETEVERLTRQLEGDPPALPGPLGDLVRRMLARDPEGRPQGMGEVCEALARAET